MSVAFLFISLTPESSRSCDLLCARIGDLELAIERMKQQQETLQKKLKEESDQKVKIEVSQFSKISALSLVLGPA